MTTRPAFCAGPSIRAVHVPPAAILALAAALGGCSSPPGGPGPVPNVDASRFDEAARQLIEERLAAARARPSDGEAAGRAAMALHAYRVLEPARTLYRLASDVAPGNFRWHYLLGLVCSDLGLQPEAEAALRAAAGLAEDDLFVRLRLAEAVLAADRPVEALGIYDSAAAARPDSMAAQFGRGAALSRLGRSGEALIALERAASLGGDYRPLYYQLAAALRAAGREDESERFLALYQRLDPTPRTPFPDPLLREVEELRDGSYRHHLNRGMRHEAAGRLDDAAREYELASEAGPGQHHALVNLVSVFGKMGRFDAAEQAYREAVGRNPDIEEAHYNFAVALSRQGRHDDAAAAYRLALGVNPYSADARLNLGDSLERLGRVEDASEQFLRILSVRPDHRLASFRLGMSLHRRGRLQEALPYLRRAVEVRDRETAQFLTVLARAERAAGNEADAVRHAADARGMARRHGRAELLAILDREFPPGR